jgi:ferredoxin
LTIPGSEFSVQADLVLVAVGQEVDLDFFPEEFRPRLIHRGLIRTDDATTMTPCRGVFAAGDAVAGPTTVIDAIADGHRAASSIRRFLECGEAGVADQRPELRAAAELELPDSPPLTALRVRPRLAGVQRGREFSEVEATLSEEEAVAEARRCLRCGPCGDCRSCAPSCRRRHIMIRSAGHTLAGDSTTMLVRAPGSVALHLSTRQATPGRLLPEARPRLLGEIGAEEGKPVELLPVRARVEPASCRACGLCVEVCPFGAIEPGNPAAAGEAARIEPALCRGCNLCIGVCPTGAARPTALSAVWWGERLGDAFRVEQPFVVLACQRRAGAVESSIEVQGAHVEVLRFRCVGQIDAAMLLDLKRLGARGVLVAGCSKGRCRFGSGARLAAEQTDRARAILAFLGAEHYSLISDWSGDRAGDRLEPAMSRLIRGGTDPATSRETAFAH